MGKAVISVILLGFISGLTSGAGVLPDGPLNASVGGTVTFTVSPVEGQLFSVEWQFKGKQIFTSNPAVNTTLPGYEGRIFYFPSTGSLELKTVSLNDSGEYRVSIAAESGLHEGSVTLDVYGLTSGAGVLPDGPLNASVGGTVMFTVSPVEGQLFSVEWQFKGKQIFTSNPAVNTTLPGYEGRIFYFPSTGSLELKTVSVNDSGEYGVSISAESGAHEGSVTLDVYEPVSNVTVSVSGTDLLESDSVQLSCSVSAGSSPLHFLWTKSSSEVTASDRVQITATDEVSNLTITNVTRYDEGTYNCTVSNLVSSETSDGVNLILSYGPENTILHVTPSQEEYKEGEDITLSCSADSRPEAQFKWFVNEEELTNTGSELRLTNLQTDDSGSYSCMASNSRTSKSERSAPVSVNVTQSGDVPAPPCPPGCIAGIVIACLVVCGGAAAAGYFVYKKKVRKPQPTATVELQQAKQGHIYENMSLGRTVGQQQANQGHVYENMPSGRKEGQAKEQHVYENPSPVYAKK